MGGAAILALLLYSQHEFSLGSIDTYLNKKIFRKKEEFVTLIPTCN